MKDRSPLENQSKHRLIAKYWLIYPHAASSCFACHFRNRCQKLWHSNHITTFTCYILSSLFNVQFNCKILSPHESQDLQHFSNIFQHFVHKSPQDRGHWISWWIYQTLGFCFWSEACLCGSSRTCASLGSISSGDLCCIFNVLILHNGAIKSLFITGTLLYVCITWLYYTPLELGNVRWSWFVSARSHCMSL